MQNRINPKAPPARSIKNKCNKLRLSKQDKWEALSPVNDRIIDGMLCELYKRKRIEDSE